MILILFVNHEKINYFKRKYSNSFEVNVGLPTTNVVIPIPKNVDVPILENIHSPISENVDVPIPRNIHSPIPENADIPIPENNHISQTKFQKHIHIFSRIRILAFEIVFERWLFSGTGISAFFGIGE